MTLPGPGGRDIAAGASKPFSRVFSILFGAFTVCVLALCVLVLLFFFYLCYFVKENPRCESWFFDLNFALNLASYSGSSLANMETVDVVHIYRTPGKTIRYYSECTFLGVEARSYRDREHIFAIARALQAEATLEGATNRMTGPVYHIVFVDQDRKRFGYAVAILGTGEQEYARVYIPGLFSVVSVQIADFLRDIGMVQ